MFTNSAEAGRQPVLTIRTVIGGAWQDFQRHWSSLVIFMATFKFLEAWLLVPATGFALGMVMLRAGHVAVSDWDILDFLLTPLGLTYAGMFSLFTAALLLFEQSAIMVMVDPSASFDSPSATRRLPIPVRQSWKILRLGMAKLFLLSFTLVPFVLLLGLTYSIFLTSHDINYYLAERPAAYWYAISLGVVLILAAGAAGIWLAIRWSFALPILLFERISPRDALRCSHTRVKGIGWQVGVLLLGW